MYPTATNRKFSTNSRFSTEVAANMTKLILVISLKLALFQLTAT